jgi:hypothetical protein
MDVQAVTAYVCEYLQRWYGDTFSGTTDIAAARVLLAAGRGPARIPTCEHILRHMRLTDRFGALKFRPLLLRTLSLFGPGELRALRVTNQRCFDLILPELDRPASLRAIRLAQALSSLRAVSWAGYGTGLKPAFDFIERHGAAITELDCDFWSRDDDAADRALACCTRLESLTNARSYDAKVWLGLTHLHTLRGVDLGVVSVAAIAAALPRLHTFAAFISDDGGPPVPHTAVAGFFKDLVPRLRVLHYHGPWPPEEDHTPTVIVPQPLPLLQEMMFLCTPASSVERGFIGAQPAMLQMPHAAIADMLLAAPLMMYRPLARVCDLWLAPGAGGGVGDPHTSDIARLLRAAPQLRNFNGGSLQGGLDWLDNPAFTGLVHPWLRSVRVHAGNLEPASAGCGVQLRRLHFPRLHQFIVNSAQHLVHDE